MSSQKITIRKALIDDIDKIKQIDTVVQIDISRADAINHWFREDFIIVAVIDGQVVGYGVYNLNFFHQGQVEMLMIHPEYRGQHIGEKLIKALESYCETPKLFITTNLSNQIMQRLLIRLGYATCGFITELDPGDPELVFFKQLG